MKIFDWLLETESPANLRKEIANLRKEIANREASIKHCEVQIEDFKTRYDSLYKRWCDTQNDLKHCSRNLENANFQIALLNHELKKLKWHNNANVVMPTEPKT